MLTNKKTLGLAFGVLMLMEYFDGAALNLIFPSMATSFNIAPVNMKIALTCYLVAESIFIPISGYLSSRYNLKTILKFAVLVTGFSSLGCAMSPNLAWLILFRTIQGISAAFVAPTCRYLIIKTFDKSEQLKAINLVMSVALIGLIMGPTLGAVLAAKTHWRFVFIFMLPLSLINYFVVSNFLPSSNDLRNEKFDIFGYLLLAIALILFYCFFDLIIKYSHITVLSGILFIASLVFIISYRFWANKKHDAIIPKVLFENKQFMTSIICNFLFRVLFASVLFVCSFILQVHYGLSLIRTGVYLSVYGLGMIVSKKTMGIFVSKLGYLNLLKYNSLLLTIIVITLAYIIFVDRLSLLECLLFLYGVSASIHYSTLNVINLRDVNKELQSKANTSLNSVRLLGTNFGITFCALLISINQQGLLKSASISLVAVCLIGIYGFFIFSKIQRVSK